MKATTRRGRCSGCGQEISLRYTPTGIRWQHRNADATKRHALVVRKKAERGDTP